MCLHRSAVLAEEAQLLVNSLERFWNLRGLHAADKAALVNIRQGMQRIRDRHRTVLQQNGMECGDVIRSGASTGKAGRAAGGSS
ncbi:hypothetical protein [Oleidesulfovibrio alaskensis]|uniref:hypothetical protein n=1 Tax=Oleidesulfovibrio alaskensis TaxID=58180 RepID=UPI001A41D36E|nr:hypothetical protein [Oleidesulfovibrio alaskensis]MBL3580836.1 hypothetical protein [Oleidesulfovibrio alaskensis]MBL3587913.1 hypothetical protein [bacterium]